MACSIDENKDTTSFFFDAIPIEEVIVPDQFIRGETTEITVSYFRPSSCHSFSGFEFEGFNSERTVAIINVVINDDEDSCEDFGNNDLRTESFTFNAGFQNSYTFKFWQGKDPEGNSKFLTKEITVVEK